MFEQCPEIISNLKGAVVVGANAGQEINILCSYGVKNQIYFEPVVEAFSHLRYNLYNKTGKLRCYNYAISDVTGPRNFFMGMETGNSSLFDLSPNRPPEHHHNKHKKEIEVYSITLDHFFATEPEISSSDYNFLYIDTQGSELLVLKGAENFLNNVDFIYTEVSYYEIYKDGVLYEELNEFLNSKNFYKLYSRNIIPGPGQEDIIYGRKN